MRVEGRVGVGRYSDDLEVPPRIGSQGETIVSELNGKYYEQTMRGNAFVYATAAAGVTLAAPTTSTVPIIWNPSGSGKILIITKVAVGYVSATSSAGNIIYCTFLNCGAQVGTAAPFVSLTQVAGVNLLIGGGNQSVMRFAPTTVSMTTGPTYLCPMGVSMVAQTAATANNPWTMIDEVDGRIIITPGNAFAVAANAAVAMVASVAIYGLELPVPLTM